MIHRINCRINNWPGLIENDSILDTIGNTPLVGLTNFLETSWPRLFAKLEFFNPGGSAKDRPALRMIQHAIECGDIDDRTTIIESSSGNMGVALAHICRYFDLPFVCVVDPHAQSHNLQIIQALGARIERVSREVDGSYLAARWIRVQQLLDEIDNSFWPNQYANRANPEAHAETTIREIVTQLDGQFDVLFVATSSTGTASGCQAYLKKIGHPAKIVAIDAVGSVLFGGTPGPRKIPGLGAGREPALAVGQNFDRIVRVTDIDCVVGCRRAADREAVLVGGSAGGVLQTIRRMQIQLRDKTVVAILHDSGQRYLDTIFSDEWVQQELGTDAHCLGKLVGDTNWHESKREQSSCAENCEENR